MSLSVILKLQWSVVSSFIYIYVYIYIGYINYKRIINVETFFNVILNVLSSHVRLVSLTDVVVTFKVNH